MIRSLRAAAFAVAEGARLYVAAGRDAAPDLRGLRREVRPAGVALVRNSESRGA